MLCTLKKINPFNEALFHSVRFIFKAFWPWTIKLLFISRNWNFIQQETQNKYIFVNWKMYPVKTWYTCRLNYFKKSKRPLPFLHKTIASNNYFALILQTISSFKIAIFKVTVHYGYGQNASNFDPFYIGMHFLETTHVSELTDPKRDCKCTENDMKLEQESFCFSFFIYFFLFSFFRKSTDMWEINPIMLVINFAKYLPMPSISI